MTTDAFTTAARAEAGTLYAVDWDTPAYYDGEDRREAEQFLAGAEWARDHLARQEVTEDALDLAQEVWETAPFGEDVRDTLRRALTAAKEARA